MCDTKHCCLLLLCVDQRENKTLKMKSVVYIFPREEVDPDQNAVISYLKVNSRKPKPACELSQSTAYQSIVGYCSLETANSCS